MGDWGGLVKVVGGLGRFRKIRTDLWETGGGLGEVLQVPRVL